MKRRDFLKTIAIGAVGAVVPLPALKTYFVEKTYNNGDQITISGVPQQIMWDMVQGKADPCTQLWWSLKPGTYEYERLRLKWTAEHS